MKLQSPRAEVSAIALRVATVVLLPLLCSPANAATVNFSGISSALVSSPAGQDFTYLVGPGPTTGVLNVRLVSGDISTLTRGASPDPNGFYILQNGALSPALFRFSFDVTRSFLINSNETLTQLETNTFSLPSGGSAWTVISSSNATVDNTGSQVSFLGSPQYGQFAVSAGAGSIDFLVSNAPGFPLYGSAISIEVVDQATPTKATSWGRTKALYR